MLTTSATRQTVLAGQLRLGLDSTPAYAQGGVRSGERGSAARRSARREKRIDHGEFEQMNGRSARWKARGKVGLAVSALFLAAHAQAAQLEPPKTVGALRLVHALRGNEALQAINRLHGKELAAAEGYVAHYERNSLVAMLYVSRPASPTMAAAQVERMATGIRAGKTPFSHLKSSDSYGTTVYSALGQGQIHYFYRRGADVIWIAADPPVAREVVEYLLQRDP